MAKEIITIPLTVLLYDGPIARAYLELMYHVGLRPERIIHMVPLAASILPTTLRLKYSAKMQDMRINHWPRQIRNTHKNLYETMTDIISSAFDFPKNIYDEMLAKPSYTKYSDNIETVMVDGLKDPKLIDYLKVYSPAAILYTGGGIVPPALLEIHGLRFLHIHPGYLPDIKGADGLLWSSIVRGNPAASCFYMEPGIDTGDIILAKEFSAVTFPLPTNSRPDDKTLYRAIFSYYDPIIRAKTLTYALRLGNNFSKLNGISQSVYDGTTYHFMSQDIMHAALEKIFPTS